MAFFSSTTRRSKTWPSPRWTFSTFITKFSSICPKVRSSFLGFGGVRGVDVSLSESTLITSLIGVLDCDRASLPACVGVPWAESVESRPSRFDLISRARLCLLSSAAKLVEYLKSDTLTLPRA